MLATGMNDCKMMIYKGFTITKLPIVLRFVVPGPTGPKVNELIFGFEHRKFESPAFYSKRKLMIS